MAHSVGQASIFRFSCSLEQGPRGADGRGGLGAGVFAAPSATVMLRNSLLDANTGDEDCDGQLDASSYNLVNTSSCSGLGGTSVTGQSAQLGIAR